jgi:hypothetical protein
VASFSDRERADYRQLARAYLEKFPFAADWFQLGDFSIVAFTPSGSARFIAGFARAMTVSAAQLHDAVGGGGTSRRRRERSSRRGPLTSFPYWRCPVPIQARRASEGILDASKPRARCSFEQRCEPGEHRLMQRL